MDLHLDLGLLWHHQHSLYRIESTAGWLPRVEENGTCVVFAEGAGKVGKGRDLPKSLKAFTSLARQYIFLNGTNWLKMTGSS